MTPTRPDPPSPRRSHRGIVALPARPSAFLAAVLGLAALLAPLPARAAGITNDECMGCHSEPSLQGGSGRSLFVDLGRLKGSPHGSLACTSCHGGIKELPHAERLPEVHCASCHRDAGAALEGSVHGTAYAQKNGAGCTGCHGAGHAVRRASRTGTTVCASCHPKVAAEYQGSVHGVAFAKGDPEASTCRDCHGPFHSIRPHTDPQSPVFHGNLARTCARCHADQEKMARRRITIPEATLLYEKSVHGRSKNGKAATCNDCHESHNLKRANDPTSSIYRTNIPHTCGRCHQSEMKAYDIGIHGQALARGVTKSPNCTDCHGEHLIRGPNDPDSPVRAGAVTMTCSRCHEAQSIRETFGLPAGRLSSYQDSFHGLAARGGSPAVANCASCHGYHDVLPSSDPRSMVSPARLPETCGRCHPGAVTKFTAMGSVHGAIASPDNPILYWVRWIYLSLIFGTIGGMALHQGLHFARGVRRHLRIHQGLEPGDHPASQRFYVRMTKGERIQHFLLLTSFFTLVFTGFALKFPETWLFSWLARLEGGYALRSIVHRVAAVVMTVTAFVHIGYLFTKRGRGTVVDLLPTLRDVREVVANFGYLLGLRKSPPAFERFSYIEKAEYWALVWGTVVMTVTGLMLWFASTTLQFLPRWTLDVATMVHYYEAWLAFLAIVVWHLYQNILNPDVYPMNWTWLTGLISEEHLRHEHGGEWARIQNTEGEGPEVVVKEPPAPGAHT